MGPLVPLAFFPGSSFCSSAALGGGRGGGEGRGSGSAVVAAAALSDADTSGVEGGCCSCCGGGAGGDPAAAACSPTLFCSDDDACWVDSSAGNGSGSTAFPWRLGKAARLAIAWVVKGAACWQRGMGVVGKCADVENDVAAGVASTCRRRCRDLRAATACAAAGSLHRPVRHRCG